MKLWALAWDSLQVDAADRRRQSIRMKPKRPRRALEQNPPALADQIKPIRPARIRELHLIVDSIHQRWEVDPKLAYASICYVEPLRLIGWTVEQDAVLHIRLHLPHVGRMRLEDVHGVEINLALVLLCQLVQGGNLPPKRRSGIAPEHQNHRSLRPQRRQIARSRLVQ